MVDKSQVYGKIKECLVEALGVEEAEIVPGARIMDDLGAESIDFLDIVFQLERAFNFKIAQGELFPEGVTQDPRFVKDGMITSEGLTALKARLPHVDFSTFEKDPRIANVAKVFTVDTLVNFVEKKLAKQPA